MVKYVDLDKKYYLHEGKLEYLSSSSKGKRYCPLKSDMFILKFIS